jgi:hypothetical protein
MSTADRRASDATDPNVPSDQNASSVRTTISRKKHAANRRNARRSTGPRTETGKKTSSRNAVTHALFCRLLVRGEPREQLLELRESLRDALAPADAVEHGFFDSIVAARWQLSRLRGAARHLHEHDAARIRLWGGERLARLEGDVEDLDGSDARERRRIYEAIRNLEESVDAADGRPRRQRGASDDGDADDDRETRRAFYESALNDPLSVGLTMALDLARGPGSAWERLSRYEQRLEQNVARAMRELRAYRSDLRAHGRPAPADDEKVDDTDKSGKAQNEPTVEQTAASNGTAGGCEELKCDSGVSPVRAADETRTGETPVSRTEVQTRDSGG